MRRSFSKSPSQDDGDRRVRHQRHRRVARQHVDRLRSEPRPEGHDSVPPQDEGTLRRGGVPRVAAGSTGKVNSSCDACKFSDLLTPLALEGHSHMMSALKGGGDKAKSGH